MGRLLILIALVFAGWWFYHWFRNTPPQQVSAVLRKALLWGGIGLLVLAVVTGRLNPVFAAVAAMIPVLFRVLNLLQMLPALQRLLQSLGLIGPGGTGPLGGGAGGGPRVGFVSLGCPKATVDSERILTQLRAEGYGLSPDYQGADLVDRQHLRLHRRRGGGIPGRHRRGPGRERPGHRHRLSRGPRGGDRDAHPSVLAVTGAHAYAEVMDAVHTHLPPPAHPFTSLLPAQGVKLTPTTTPM
jgi:hypothetical protein